MSNWKKIPVSVLIFALSIPLPFSIVLFDLYHIICSIFLLSSLPLYHAIVGNTVRITRLSLCVVSSPLRRCIVGSRTILIDTHGNCSRRRQQTVVVQGQHKTINHNSWFRPPERSRSRSTKKQFCQHMFTHLSSSATGLFWALVTAFSFTRGFFLSGVTVSLTRLNN